MWLAAMIVFEPSWELWRLKAMKRYDTNIPTLQLCGWSFQIHGIRDRAVGGADLRETEERGVIINQYEWLVG